MSTTLNACTNVTIYPYIPDAPIEVPPVFTHGAGTMDVKFLGENIYYNLDLTTGKAEHGGPIAGNRYWADYEMGGQSFHMVDLTCIQGGSNPRFGRTRGKSHSAAKDTAAVLPLSSLLKDVSVKLYVSPPIILEVPLIRGAAGIATVGGNPALWAVTISGGGRVNTMKAGMSVTVTGTYVANNRPFAPDVVFTVEDASESVLLEQSLIQPIHG
jgi:hypothetical protein